MNLGLREGGDLRGSGGIASPQGLKGTCEKEARTEGKIRRVVVVTRTFGGRIQYSQFRDGRTAVRIIYNRRVRSMRGARGLTWSVLNLNEVKQGASFGR